MLQQWDVSWVIGRRVDSADEAIGHFSNGYALSANTGVLDALYQRDGAWMLVEFKTDRVQDVAEAESLLERAGYRAQAERYLAAADRLLDKPVRGLVCWLDVGGAVAVSPVL